MLRNMFLSKSSTFSHNFSLFYKNKNTLQLKEMNYLLQILFIDK